LQIAAAEQSRSAPTVPLAPYDGGHDESRREHDENQGWITHHDALPKASLVRNTGHRRDISERPLMGARRFPPPWSVEELDACFVVRDQSGQALAYVYFEDERADERQPKVLTPDKACPLRSVFEGGQDCKSRFHSSRPSRKCF
jgi:hypothetical protein